MKFLVRKAPEHFIRTVNDEISSLLNRHFDSYFPEAAYWEDVEKFSMPVEITDKGRDYEVRAELPGVKKEDLDIDIDKNYIIINAKKEEEHNEDEKAYKICEDVVRLLKIDGQADFDFRYDKNGNPILMEVNPRIAATMKIFKEGGMNLVYLRIKQLLGEKLPEINVRYGVRLVRRYIDMFSL